MSEAPTLPAYRLVCDGENCANKILHATLHIWCEFCVAWHAHGEPEGHRVADCFNPDSPYRNGGYILKTVGDFTPEVKRMNQGRRAWRAR